jgi:drug/metabolite transporter (DMT)-like permease
MILNEMMSGYPFLGLAVVSFGILGVLHKVADHRRCQPSVVTGFLFLWAGIAMSVICVAERGIRSVFQMPFWVCAAALLFGVFASLSILNFQHGVRFGKISTSWLIMNLSTAVPVILSILIYKEHIRWKRALGLTLAVVALLLLWIDRHREESGLALATPREEQGRESSSEPIRR